MVRRFYAPLLVTALAFSACTCDTGPLSQSRGIFQLRDDSVDFGTPCVGATAERTVTLANTGNAPLTIESIEFQGDAFALLEDAPETIARGEEIVLSLGFTPQREGGYTGSVTITTDAHSDAVQTITMVGRGFVGKEQDIEITCEGAAGEGPCFFLTWDDVLVGGTGLRSVDLTNRGCRDVNVNEAFFTSDNPGHEAFFSIANESAPFRVRGGETVSLDLLFSAPAEELHAQATLVLKTDDPEVKAENRGWAEGEWRVTAWANAVKPNLQVSTDLLTFFDGQEGIPLERSFTVINNGSSALEVRDVSLVHEEGRQDYTLRFPDGMSRFTLQPLGAGDHEREITVVYTSTGAGPARARVEIDADPEHATVRLVGGTEPTLVLTWLNPDDGQWHLPPVHFGNTPTGASGVKRTVRINNNGTADLIVNEVRLEEGGPRNPSFEVPPFSGTIAPEDHHEFAITFNDNIQVRNDQTKLEILSNDPLYVGGAYQADLISINEPNFAPVAIIRTSGAAETHQELTLDGSSSTDPDGDSLTFEWTVTAQPNGANAELESPNDPVTRVVSRPSNPAQVCPPGPVCEWLYLPGSYSFRLRVTDSFGNTGEAIQNVQVFGQ